MKYALMFLLILPPASAQTAMTFAEAMAKAETIWGSTAQLGQLRKSGANFWTRQVGYTDTSGKFSVVGQGRTWELAFANIPTGYVSPTLRTLTAVARDAAGNVSESSVHVAVCNSPCVPGVVDRVGP